MIDTNTTKQISNYIDFLEEGGTNCILIMSRAGMGKSYTVEQILKQKQSDYVIHSGYMTAKNIYEIMYNNNGKTIVLDDMGGIFTQKSLSILKPALFNNSKDRVISYLSNKTNLPSKFNFTGRLIVLTNTIPNKENEDVRALISRTTSITINYSREEFEILCSNIVSSRLEKDQLKQNVVYEIINNLGIDYKTFNLRQLDQIIKLVEYKSYLAPSMYNQIMEAKI